jgi:hypothetical protein
MTPSKDRKPGLISLAIARWEVSPLGTIPSSLSLLALPFLFVAAEATQAIIDDSSSVPALAIFGLWLIVVVFDFGRGIWTLAHPYASARWLHAVRCAVGTTLADCALDHLVICYGDNPDYVIKRSDMTIAVQVAKRQRPSRQACGVRLADYQRS